MRAAPARTAISPPHTAASRMATPSGRLQFQPKKANSADSVFWAMKISRTMRMRKPPMTADHNADARVKCTADFGLAGGRTGTSAGTTGGSGVAYGSVLMESSFPLTRVKETTGSTHSAVKVGVAAGMPLV